MPTPHAITRALERYDIQLTYQELSQLRDELLAGKWMLSRPVSDGKSLYSVVIHGKPALALFDPREKRICTFFHPNWTVSKALRKKKKRTRFGPKWRALEEEEESYE